MALPNVNLENTPYSESSSQLTMPRDVSAGAQGSREAILHDTFSESQKDTPASNGLHAHPSEQVSPIGSGSLEREHHRGIGDSAEGLSASGETAPRTGDLTHVLLQQALDSAVQDTQERDYGSLQRRASRDSDVMGKVVVSHDQTDASDTVPTPGDDTSGEQAGDTEMVQAKDSSLWTESNSILRDIFETTKQSMETLKDVTEKGSQEIKDQLTSLVQESKQTNNLLCQLVDQLKAQQQNTEVQMKNLLNQLTEHNLPQTTENQLGEYVPQSVNIQSYNVSISDKDSPLKSHSISQDNTRGRGIKSIGEVGTGGYLEQDQLSVYKNRPGSHYQPPLEKMAPEQPRMNMSGQNVFRRAHLPDSLPQTSSEMGHSTTGKLVLEVMEPQDARHEEQFSSSDEGNNSQHGQQPGIPGRSSSTSNKTEQYRSSETQNKQATRHDSPGDLNEKKHEKEMNTSSMLPYKQQDNLTSDDNGQPTEKPKDARPKERRAPSFEPKYTDGKNHARSRVPSGMSSSPRHRSTVSAMGLTLESGSEGESTQLSEAVERARAPDPDPAPKAKSFDTVLCLDISQSMWDGDAFEQMIDIANRFIDGVEDIVNDSGTEENIGVVTFGGRANVVQHLTNDFSRVRDAIERIEVGGKSPFFEAMVVSLVAFDGRGGTVSVSGEYDVRPRIIFISDGHITEAADDLGVVDRVIDASNTRAQFSRLMMDISPSKERSAGMPHPIIFIPVGERADRNFLKAMATLNNSPLVEPEDTESLCRYYRVQGTIGKVIVTLHNQENGGTEENIKAVVCALEPDLDENEMSQVVKTVQEELSQPGRVKQRNSKPTDFDDVFEDKAGVLSGERLPLGTRVVRGPDWHWGNQDNNGPGTVIQHDNKRHPFTWVLWDSGEYNRYAYGPEMGYQIWSVEDRPRLEMGNEGLQIGMRVRKGRNTGSIIRKSKDGQQIKVRLENGEIEACNIDAVTYCDPFDTEQDNTGPQTLAEDLFGHKLDLGEPPQTEEEMEGGILVWQWRDDRGNWRLYSEKNLAALEKAYKRKKDGTCIIQRDGQSFRVVFKRKVEKSVDCGIEREVKRLYVAPEEYESLRTIEEIV